MRWVLPGDVATVVDDGTIQLLGRGSVCINTGGEKVFPEEVEACVVGHPAVYDVLVVGVPDDRWGQRVAAVVQPVAGADADADGARRALPGAARRLQGAAATGSFVDQVAALAVGQGRLRLGQAGRRRRANAAIHDRDTL